MHWCLSDRYLAFVAFRMLKNTSVLSSDVQTWVLYQNSHQMDAGTACFDLRKDRSVDKNVRLFG